MITDEQIIAAAGEPVYQVCKSDSVSLSSAWIDVTKQTYTDAGLYSEYGRRTLYTADAILSAAKPLRERIVELEAKLGDSVTFDGKTAFEFVGEELFYFQNVTGCNTADEYKNDLSQLRQQNAELTKQIDGLLVSLKRIVADSDGTCLASVRHLARIADKAIAKVKDAA